MATRKPSKDVPQQIDNCGGHGPIHPGREPGARAPSHPAVGASHFGVYTSFDYPGALDTFPGGINPSGVIVGGYLDTTGNEHGFIRTP